jgi:molybdate transport system permease protein
LSPNAVTDRRDGVDAGFRVPVLSADEWTAIALSLKVAFWATVLSIPLGIAIAFVLARKSFWGKSLLDGLVLLPLVLPPVVTGYFLLILFGRNGPLGALLAQFGVVLAFRWTGAVLSCGIMAFPLMVRAMRVSFEAVDQRLEAAAATLGAGALRRFLTITLPLAVPGMIAGAVLAFARALGEFGATITFVSNIPGETQTISAAIYSFLQVPGGDPAALRLAAVSIVIALAALSVSEWLARRAGARLHGL